MNLKEAIGEKKKKVVEDFEAKKENKREVG